MYRLSLVIHGRVQGVFFRESTCREAQRLGLVGEVKNNADGTVGVVVEGPKEKLEQLKKFCQIGPPQATVEEMNESWKQIPHLSFTNFVCSFH